MKNTILLGLLSILAAFVIVATVAAPIFQATPQVAFADQPGGVPHSKCHCKDGAGHHHP